MEVQRDSISIPGESSRTNRRNRNEESYRSFNGGRLHELGEVTLFNLKPYIILHCVDDLYCVFNSERELEMFFAKISTIHANIQLTKALEQNNRLPYLDVLIIRADAKFETTVFRKKTNTC